jgi:hypothetical protein
VSLDGLPWLAFGALAAAWLVRVGWRRADRHARVRRARRAFAGEADAVRLLERAGARILDRQVRRTVTYTVDGAPRSFELRADLLVRDRGRRAVAEVKTGRHGAGVDRPGTRRQLLEYGLAFGVRRVLLVLPETGEIHRMEVPAPKARPGPAVLVGLLGLAAGAVGAWLALR